jgi:hypothetical protein
VDVPAGAHELTLAWTPPAFDASLAVALLGAALAAGHGLARGLRRRRGRAQVVTPEPTPAVAEPVGSR